MLAFKIDNFNDGRFFSLARLLRERFHYTGEICAFGNIILDQLFYMKQCGFNGFIIPNCGDTSRLGSYFSTFSENYQAVVGRKPAFDR